MPIFDIVKTEFHYKKRFGQHFLQDKNIAKKIVKIAQIVSNDIVWEIGPGHGILTEEILKYTSNLYCFEIDKTLFDYLEKKYSINLIKSDILKFNWENLLKKDTKIKVVSNLPYQITSPFLFKLVEYKDFFKKIVIMIQKEVAERLNAKPNTKKYGILSIKIGFYFDVSYEFNVKSHLFYPKPKVESAVISLVPKNPIFDLEDSQLFWKIVEILFRNRRKMIRNNMKTLLDKKELINFEKITEIPLTKRAENLNLNDFYKIYKFLKNKL